MASRRQRKKNLKKAQERKIIQSGISEKQVKKYTTEERQKAYKIIIQKEHRKEKVRQLYNEKKLYIENKKVHGVKPSDSWETIKKKERHQRNTRRKTEKFFELQKNGVPEDEARKLVFGRKEITWEEVKKYSAIEDRVFKISKAFAIGYRDYSENLTIAEIYSYSAFLSIETLKLSFLDIVRQKPTYNRKKKHSSSGKAGNFSYYFGSKQGANNYPAKKKNEAFSFFVNNGEFAIYEFTLDKMMILAHAIMNNITEDRRSDFYNNFYLHLCSVVPEARDYFPAP